MEFRIEHLGLPSRDPRTLKDWYVSVLGARVLFESGQTPPTYFVSLPGGPMLEIYAGDASLPDTANNRLAWWRHVALRVESIESARAELAGRGVRFTEEVKPAGGGGRVLFFADKDGNLLHLVERPEGRGWELD